MTLRLFIIVAALVSPGLPAVSHASVANDYELSYHRLLLSQSSNAYQKLFKPGCVDKIRTVLKSGKNFEYPEMRQALVPLKAFRRENSLYRNRFFHWTRAETMKDIAKRNDYRAIYSFYRASTRTEQTLPWGQSLHVADEPNSTSPRGTKELQVSAYGDILISVNLSSSTNVLDAAVGPSSVETGIWLKTNFPELEGCIEDNGDGNGGPINYLVFEDSGVDLLLYIHLQGKIASSWYMLLNPLSIDSLRYEVDQDSIAP